MSNKPVESSRTTPVPMPVSDESLTIPAKRLAGSVHCLNCGSELKGPFCHYCGQPDRNFMRFFPVLLRELLADFLDLDSRFARTMKPLLFRPGKLTRDYLSGRRFRYTPPLRLYIFSSMSFSILAALLAGSAVVIDAENGAVDDATDAIRIGVRDHAELERARAALDSVEPGLADRLLIEVGEANEAAAPGDGEPADRAEDDDDDDDTIMVNGEPWDKETNPVVIPIMPDFVNEWINDEIEETPQKGKEIEANPNLIIDKVFDVLPVTMFLLLPLVALLLKFWYAFARRYYVEHLIMALHVHAFLFVIFLLTMIFNTIAGWQEPGGEGPFTTAAFWVNLALLIWIPAYFLIALKRVYQQGWLLTLGKYFVVGVSYLVLLAFITSVVAVTSFVLL